MPSDILFEHPEWTAMPQVPAKYECGWANQQGLVAMLSHFGVDNGLRNHMDNVKGVRDHHRREFAKQEMGLIECDVFDMEGLRAVRAIGKALLQPTGAAYIGTIGLPLPKESYLLQVMAQERGITGIRETAVMLKTSIELEKKGFAFDLPPEAPTYDPAIGKKMPIIWRNSTTGAVLRWDQDPYDPKWSGPCLRNLADAPEHDSGFLQHPLTQVRLALKCFDEGLKFSDGLKARAKEPKWWSLW